MEHEEREATGKGEAAQERGGKFMDGLNISKRALWSIAGGALGALALPVLGKVFERARPVVVGVVKESYGFKEWMAGKLERAKEDAQDIMAEAAYQYQQDQNATADSVKREKELFDKIEKIVEARLAQATEKKEGES